MQTPTVNRDATGPKPGPRLLPLFLTLILLSAVPLVASPRSEAEGWIELSGPHFTVFSDSGPRKAKQVAMELEAFGAVLQRIYPGLSVEPLRPIQVLLFNSRGSFKKHSPSKEAEALFAELFKELGAKDDRVPPRDKSSSPLVMPARGAYQQALQQDPTFLEAYNQLGKTYLYDSGSPQPGIELMERVLARVPTVDLALTLIWLHSSNGDRDAARAVHDQHLVRLVDAMNHKRVDGVDRALIRADLIAADVWAEQGRAQDALALAQETEGKTDDEELGQEIADRIRAYSSEITAAEISPADIWWQRMHALCPQAFTGAMTSQDPADAAFAEQPMTMHARSCAEQRLEIAFNVGENRSRTWVITRTDQGLRLQHDHRHEDGSEDAVSLYGGYATTAGTEVTRHFPADDFSKQLFEANDLGVSVANVWSMEIVPGERFTYILRRPERHFQVDFDLTRAVDPPPASWGHE